MSIEKDIELDKYNLDEEVENIAQLHYTYLEKLREAKENLLNEKAYYDIEKTKYNVAKSKKELEIRRGDISMDVKITEGAIKAYLEQDEDLLVINKGLEEINKSILAKMNEELQYNNMLKSIETKAKMIPEEIKLYRSDYYSEPVDAVTRPKREV